MIGLLLLDGVTRTLKTDSGISKVTNITKPIARTVQPNPIWPLNLWKMIGYKIPPAIEKISAVVRFVTSSRVTDFHYLPKPLPAAAMPFARANLELK